MKQMLIAYATTEGQTRRIATFVADELQRSGQAVDLVDVASPAVANLSPIYAAVILAGSVHAGAHQAALRDFVKRNRDWLSACPTALLSVSLTAALNDDDSRAACRAEAQKFLDDTGLVPGVVLPVAGALPYTQYDWFKRFAMKSIARKRGGDTDTSRDFEYTDWSALAAFAHEFVGATGLDTGR